MIELKNISCVEKVYGFTRKITMIFRRILNDRLTSKSFATYLNRRELKKFYITTFSISVLFKQNCILRIFLYLFLRYFLSYKTKINQN